MIKIAIPTTEEGKVSSHFGHCPFFNIYTVDENEKQITESNTIVPPAHEPGLLPKWLSEMQVQLVLAGGIGQRAIGLFEQNNIKVLPGVQSIKALDAVNAYLEDNLSLKSNACDH